MRWILSLKKPRKYREFATILTIGLHMSRFWTKKWSLKTAYSKNYSGHINYLPTCFTNKKKTFDTRDSRVVPHRSTDRAQWCLTSQFGWDAVYPPWCDRMMLFMFL